MECNANGDCSCKEGVTGSKCDRDEEDLCKNGFCQSGQVSLKQDNLVTKIENYGPEFYIECKVKLLKNPPSGFTNIFHVTNGENYGAHGNRFPIVKVHSNMFFHFVTTLNDQFNYWYDVHGLKLNQEYHLRISQEYNENGQLMYTIMVDGEEVHSVENTNPISINEALVYLSDPWHASFGDIGELYDVKILKI